MSNTNPDFYELAKKAGALEEPTSQHERLVQEEFIRIAARREAERRLNESERGSEVWPEVDLRAIFAAGIEPVQPELMVRSDGLGLLYMGLPNCVFGDAGTGKTALAQATAADVIRQGWHVYVADYETNVRVWLTRLVALGLDPTDIATRLHYLNVSAGSRPPEPVEGAKLMVLDSLSAAVESAGLDANDMQGIQAVYRQVVDPFTSAGLAALVIDHVGHADKSRPMNSIRKTGIVQGAMYNMIGIPGLEFGRDKSGAAFLKLHKDNMGGIPYAKGEIVAKFLMTSSEGGTRVRCELVPGDHMGNLASLAAGVGNAVAQAKREVVTLLSSGQSLSRSKVREAVGGRNDTVKAAIAELLDEGVLTEKKVKNGHYVSLAS